jgi:SHS2 domain-containing protein
MSKRDGFKVIEHLSDVAIKVYAKRIEGLFEMAAMGMASIISEPGRIQRCIKKQILIKREEALGLSLEDLLLIWLEKILYLHESESMLFSDFKIKKLDLDSEVSLASEIFGENIDATKHIIHTHIKAPTYHGLQISQDKKKDKFFVEIIFDI